MSWRRQFWFLFSGSSLASMAARSSVAAYPILALLLTGSPALAGWVRFASFAPYLVFNLPFGVLVDRHDRRRLIVLSQAGRAAALAVLALTIVSDGPWLPVLWVTAVVEGALTVLNQRALEPAIAEVAPTEKIAWAVSKVEGAQAAAVLAGPSAGGFLLTVGNAFPFLTGMVAQAVAAVTSLAARGPYAAAGPPADPPEARDTQAGGAGRVRAALREMAEGVRWIWRDVFLKLAVAVFTTTNVVWQMLTILLIVLATSAGASPATIGLVLGASGAGGIIGTAVLAPLVIQRVRAMTVLRLSCWLWLGAIVVVASSTNPLIMGLGWGCVGLIAGILDVATMTYMITVTPQELLGRVTSVPATLALGLSPLGAVAGGYLVEAWGPGPVLIGAMVVVAAIGTLVGLTRAPAPAPADVG